MKKAFISGTWNEKVVEDTKKLLSIIDYSGWTALPVEKEFPLDVKKDRIKMILESDAFITRDNLTGPGYDQYNFELKLAQHIGLPIIIFGPIEGDRSTLYKRLDSLVAERILKNLRKAEDENNSKGDGMIWDQLK